MRSSTKILRASLLALCGLFAAQTASADIIIDKFTLFQEVFVPIGVLNPNATISTGQINDNGSDTFLGSDREVFVQRVSNTSANNQISVQAGFGALTYTSSEQTQGRAKIVYDGIAGDGVIANFDDAPDQYGLSLDLSNFYKLTVVAATDNKTLPFSVTLYSSAASYMTHTINLYTPNPTVPAVYNFYFDLFTIVGSAGKDDILANVKAVALAFNSNYSGQIGADSTVSLLEFTEIPEPSTMGLVGLNLLLAVGLMRKRRA